MSKGGAINYKCRACGAVYEGMHAPDVVLAIQCATFDFMRQPESWGAMTIHANDIHHCGERTWGVADLVGGIEDEKQS